MEVGARFLMWFPEPVPACCREQTGTGSGNRRIEGGRASDRGGQLIAFGRTREATFTGEIEQSRIEGRFANGTQGAQLRCGKGAIGVAEDAHDAFIQ